MPAQLEPVKAGLEDRAELYLRRGQRKSLRSPRHCRQGGAPEPILRLDAGGLWMMYEFDESYLRVVRGAGDPVILQVATGVTTEVTAQRALLRGSASACREGWSI